MPTNYYTDKYPHLFQEVIWPWGPTRARFLLMKDAPPNKQIANVNIVPRIRNKWVTIRLKDGSWEIPGGTLEPGEGYLDAIHRILREEVGAQLISFNIIGAWQCISLSDKPYRSHLPFPKFYRIVGVGEIHITKKPESPPNGELVVMVGCNSLETATAKFVKLGRKDLAELYQLASEISKIS